MAQATPHSTSSTAVSVRTRFEVFKRDDFTCRYCGRRSPEVVLQVDHITPRSAGGSNDEMNLVTSCWECNSGKSDVPLDQIITGDDPYEKALLLMERRRQLEEYNAVVVRERAEREDDAWSLVRTWKSEMGFTAEEDLTTIGRRDFDWLMSALKVTPCEVIRDFMCTAVARGYTRNFSWVAACVRNWRAERGQAGTDNGAY